MLLLYILAVVLLGRLMHQRWYIQVDQARLLELDEGRIRYLEVGSGAQAVVFLHGFDSQFIVWDSVVSSMSNCTHSLSLDLPGFGGSYWNTDNYDLASQGRRLGDFLAAKGLKRIILVGTSMGASLAASFAASQPDRVESVILLAPSGVPGSLNYGGLMGLLTAPGVPNRLATWVAKTPFYKLVFPRSIALQSLTTASSYTQAWTESLNKISVPVVVFWSLGDKIVPYAFSGKVMEQLKQGRLISLASEAGHGLPGYLHISLAALLCSMTTSGKAFAPGELDKWLEEIFGRKVLSGALIKLS